MYGRVFRPVIFSLLTLASAGVLLADNACAPAQTLGDPFLGTIDAGTLSSNTYDAFSSSGCFVQDDNQLDFTFTLSSDTPDFAAYTTQWADGSDGFAPILSLYDSGGDLLGTDGTSASPPDCGARGIDPNSGTCWDAYLSMDLGPGSYTLVLTQWGNIPVDTSLADGFALTGYGDYTAAFVSQDSGACYAPDNTARDCSYNLQIDTEQVPSTPEPVTGLMGVTGLLALLVMAGRRGMARNGEGNLGNALQAIRRT